MKIIFKRKKKNNLDLSQLDEKAVFITTLEIIGTKKCNLACAHCMRGDAQNADISPETYDTIFDKFDVIENLNIGGGEVAVSPHVLNDLVESLEKHDTIVNEFALTTNATIASDEFIASLMRVKQYVNKSASSGVSLFRRPEVSNFHIVISTDDFHIEEMLKKGYTFEDFINNIIKFRQVFGDNSVELKYFSDFEVIDEGRGKNIEQTKQVKKYIQKPLSSEFAITNIDKASVITGMLAISTDGEVLPCCNLSYDNEKVFSVGNIKDYKLSELFSRLNTKEIEFNEIDSFIRKMNKKNSVNEGDFKRYHKMGGGKKQDLIWFYSNPQNAK